MERLQLIANIGGVSYDKGRDIYFVEFKAMPETDSFEVPIAGDDFREMCAKETDGLMG